MNSRLATTVPFSDYSSHPIKVTTTATTQKRSRRPKKEPTPHRTGVHENGKEQKKKKVDREKYFSAFFGRPYKVRPTTFHSGP
jgi:hypothetical protein